MTIRTSYPWRAAEMVRESSENGAKKAHSEQRLRLDKARHALAQAVDAKRLKENQLRGFAKASAASQTACSAAQAQRHGWYAQRLRGEVEALQSLIEQARERVREHRAKLEQTRRELERAHAGRNTLEKHHHRFDIEQHKELEKQVELETEDSASPPGR